jgi:hypothetical protein
MVNNEFCEICGPDAAKIIRALTKLTQAKIVLEVAIRDKQPEDVILAQRALVEKLKITTEREIKSCADNLDVQSLKMRSKLYRLTMSN